jgi:hypothetical protein
MDLKWRPSPLTKTSHQRLIGILSAFHQLFQYSICPFDATQEEQKTFDAGREPLR